MARNKTKFIHFRLKEAEKAKLQAVADQQDVTVSEFCRMLVQQKCKRIKTTNTCNFQTVQ